MKLRAKAFLPLATLSALFFLFLYGYWFPRSMVNLEQQELQATRRHLESVGEGLVPLLLGHQLDTVHENLDALLEKNAAWMGIRLVDPGGTTLYPLQDARQAARPGRDVRVVEHEMRFLGRDLGRLVLDVDISSTTAPAVRRHRQLVTALLVVFSGSLLGIWLTVERVVRRPVDALARAAEKVAQGDFEVPLVRTGDDEVGTLVDAFARMRTSIRDHQASLLESARALQRLNRELRAISTCNQALVRAEDERSLLDTVCRVICDGAGYRLAWVGYAEHDDARTVRPVAWAGAEEGYLADAGIVWSDAERARGPSGTAIRGRESCCIQDFTTDPRAAPWREGALARGYRSSIALPLLDDAARAFGALCIYSTEPGAFTPDEARLLGDLAADLAFGITTLRARAERARAAEEIRRLNQELERRVADRTARLEEANRELEAFARSVSHDLRAPLRHIDGFAALLRRRMAAAPDEQALRHLDAISDSATRMGALIEDLLSFSRMGRQELSRTPVDLGELVRDVVREHAPDLEGRAVDWRVAELPVVNGDRAMLRVALVNLISNALKFTRPRARAEIEIGCERRAAETVVFVRDNGVGFDPQQAARLFGVFQRLHGASEFEGTGLGLANVRRVVHRHGGRVWAEGKVGEGATFYLALPGPAPEEGRRAG